MGSGESSDQGTVEGSCLCGAVTFVLRGELTAVRRCWCTNCRKFSGTSPATWAMAKTAGMTRQGEKHVGRFDSGRGIRCFCRACGAPVWFESIEYPDIVGIPLGVIDRGEIPPPEMELWVRSKPDWCPSDGEGLPQFDRGPESS